MARQEATNIFSDGLMSDLHPINTPKSVLTDCLNGTYVTYNGNEFILQNDMGNYKLKNCKLPTNFIPVGIKSYADILYIVSYNPLTKVVEIGSYPAPQRIFSIGDSETDDKENPLTPFQIDGEEEYSDIINQDKSPLFIFIGEDENAFKLYPGDEFKLTVDELELNYIYQHLDYYIIDEDKKLYDLDDADFENAPKDENDFSKVFWETPGWLAAQWNLFVPDKFNLNLRSLNVPEFLVLNETTDNAELSDNLEDWEADAGYFKVSMNLSSQTIITDTLFQETLENNFNKTTQSFEHLFIRYIIRTGTDYGTFKGIQYFDINGNPELLEEHTGTIGDDYIYFDIPCYSHNYQDDIITAYNNIYPVWQFPFPDETEDGYDVTGYKGKVELKAYPIIKIPNGATVLFTQFETIQQFDLNNLKNSGDIKIADSTYKWSVDDDSCTISFNINGPFVNSSNITGRYEIYRLNMFLYTKNEPTWHSQTSISTWGDLDLTIKTNKFGYLTNISDENVKNRTFQELDPSAELNPYLQRTGNVPGNLLMMCGDISNIVLYGQNTIDINWTDSNSILLKDYTNWYSQDNKHEIVDDIVINGPVSGSIFDSIGGPIIIKPIDQKMIKDEYTTSKTVDFSKEGGLYVFRVILEQDKKPIKIQDKLLIPSEVFNDFFGSVDNYDSISGDTWINKYIELIDYSGINIQNLNVQITPDETDKFLEYRWASNSDWILLDKESILENSGTIDWTNSDDAFRQYLENKGTILTTTQCIGLVYWIKDSNCVSYTLDTNNSNIEKRLIFSWKQSEQETTIENLFIRYNYNKIQDKTITWDSTQSIAKILKGNLWNPVIDTTANLKVGTNNTGLQLIDNGHETIFNFETFNIVQALNVEIQSLPGTTIISSYPFLDSIARGYSVGIEHTYNPWTYKHDRKAHYKVWLADSSAQNTVYKGNADSTPETTGDHKDEYKMGTAKIQEYFGNVLQNVNCALGCSFYSYYKSNLATIHSGTVYIGYGPDGELKTDYNFIIYEVSDYTDARTYWTCRRNILFVKNETIGTKTYVSAFEMPWEKICLLLRLRYDQKGKDVTWYYPLLNWEDSFVSVISYNINAAAVATKLRYLRVDDYIWKVNKSNHNLLTINYITNTKQQNNVNVPDYLFTVDLNNEIFNNVGFVLSDIIKNNNEFWTEYNNFTQNDEFLFIEKDQTALRKYIDANLSDYVSSTTNSFKVLSDWTGQQLGYGTFTDIQNSNVYLPWANPGELGGYDLKFVWDDNVTNQDWILNFAKKSFGKSQDDWASGIYYRETVSPEAIKGTVNAGNYDSHVSFCYYQTVE